MFELFHLIPRPARAAGIVGVIALALQAACGGGKVVNYPDKPGVVAAQAEWCTSLAKLRGKGDAWEHLGACKAAFPSASASYLKRVTKCYADRVRAMGDTAPDDSMLTAECNDQALLDMTVDRAAAKDVIDARCERMQRCEKVPFADCKGAFQKLETAQQAMFTSTYNGAALQSAAECLAKSECTENEELARDACYKPLAEKLLWFPN